MSFPTGGPGYPQQGGGQPQPPAPGGPPPARAGGSPSLPMILSIVVAALGLVSYFLSYSGDATGLSIVLLLAGGLVAAAGLLPQAPKVHLWSAVLSTVGGLSAVADLINTANAPGVLIVVMLVGVLQLVASVVALLLEYKVVKLPAGGGARPPQYPAYGQPGPFGGNPGKGPQQGGQQFPPPAAAPQSTVYAPQQGQFYQPDSGQQPQQGQQGQQPGTPPGGFGNQG